MASGSSPGAGAAGGGVGREAAPYVETLARAGYATKGLVYMLVGGLAALAALGPGGRTTGSTGALASIAGSTPGRIVLGLIALGLAGYVFWGLVRAGLDPENDGAGKRAYYALTAAIYGLLAFESARLALGAGGAAAGGAEHWSAVVMRQPLGNVLLGAAGIALAAFGLQQVWRAWRSDVGRRLALGALSRSARTWAIRVGRFGLAARGVVLGIIGAYLVVAAMQAAPAEARDVGEVLSTMEQSPWLLAAVALGLVAYGLFNLIRARYRVIRPG